MAYETSRDANVRRGQGQLTPGTGRSTKSVAQRARSAPEAVASTAQGRPLAAAAVAFGAGVLIARLMPPSEGERQAAQRLKKKLEPVKQEAMEAGKSMAGELQQSAQEGVQQVKQRATKATKQVKQEAQGGVSQVKQDAQSGANK